MYTFTTKYRKEIPCRSEAMRQAVLELENENPDCVIDHFAGNVLLSSKQGVTVVHFCNGNEIGSEEFLRKISTKDGLKHRVIQLDVSVQTPEFKISHYSNDYGDFVRPSMETAFMTLATHIAARSSCLRKKVGAVFTDSEMMRVLCVGYNGSFSGGPNQCDSLEPGACGCLHAEINAILKNVGDLRGSTLFVTLSPCFNCSKILLNSSVGKVVYLEQYRNDSGINLLRKYGVEVVKYSDLFMT